MEELLREVFTAHYRDVYGYLYSLSRDAALSEDLASEVFLEAVRSISGFRGESDVKTWLFSIARHRWFAHLRRKWRQPPLLTEETEPVGESLEDQYRRRETVERLRALAAGLPERSRRVLELRMEGYSYHEIGAAVGISEASARVIEFRARTKLREQLRKEGFDAL